MVMELPAKAFRKGKSNVMPWKPGIFFTLIISRKFKLKTSKKLNNFH